MRSRRMKHSILGTGEQLGKVQDGLGIHVTMFHHPSPHSTCMVHQVHDLLYAGIQAYCCYYMNPISLTVQLRLQSQFWFQGEPQSTMMAAFPL